MKIKWSLDINTGAVERSEAARARRLAGATVVGGDVIASTGYMKKQPTIQCCGTHIARLLMNGAFFEKSAPFKSIFTSVRLYLSRYFEQE